MARVADSSCPRRSASWESDQSSTSAGLTQKIGSEKHASNTSDQSKNRVELRESLILSGRLRNRECKDFFAPPPLHDFSSDLPDAWDKFSKLARSGVPGKRMLRLKEKEQPKAGGADRDEPAGTVGTGDTVCFEKVECVRDGKEVYRCTFQDLRSSVSEHVVHRLDTTDENPKTALRQFYVPQSEEDTVLVFESRFESGNLFQVIHVGEHEYDLVLRDDTKTTGHTQWFYFSVSNTRAGVHYTFNILNLLKPDSLYSHGLQPVLYSLQAAATKGVGWHRAGERIRYYGNKIPSKKSGVAYCSTLTFTLTFPFSFDTCYIAHCFPYTYGNLQAYLNELEMNPRTCIHVRRRQLCETQAGNTCDLLTITAKSGTVADLKRRKGIVISARVHPGETNSSYLVKGLIDFLVSDEPDAEEMRKKFVFKIVPMLNPDGVINGNYRCCLAGHDLNRRWDRPHHRLHAPIYQTKQMIREFQQDREVVLFCDIHGHSREKNIFIYGCGSNPTEESPERLQRIFPLLMDDFLESFSFRQCSFKVQRAKMSTGRVVCWRQLGILNSYTVEASLFGTDRGLDKGAHFGIRSLESMGRTLGLAILEQFGRADRMFTTAMINRLVAMDEVSLPTEDRNSDSETDSSSDEESDKPLALSRLSSVSKKNIANASSSRPAALPSLPSPHAAASFESAGSVEAGSDADAVCEAPDARGKGRNSQGSLDRAQRTSQSTQQSVQSATRSPKKSSHKQRALRIPQSAKGATRSSGAPSKAVVSGKLRGTEPSAEIAKESGVPATEGERSGQPGHCRASSEKLMDWAWSRVESDADTGMSLNAATAKGGIGSPGQNAQNQPREPRVPVPAQQRRPLSSRKSAPKAPSIYDRRERLGWDAAAYNLLAQFRKACEIESDPAKAPGGIRGSLNASELAAGQSPRLTRSTSALSRGSRLGSVPVATVARGRDYVIGPVWEPSIPITSRLRSPMRALTGPRNMDVPMNLTKQNSLPLTDCPEDGPGITFQDDSNSNRRAHPQAFAFVEPPLAAPRFQVLTRTGTVAVNGVTGVAVSGPGTFSGGALTRRKLQPADRFGIILDSDHAALNLNGRPGSAGSAVRSWGQSEGPGGVTVEGGSMTVQQRVTSSFAAQGQGQGQGQGQEQGKARGPGQAMPENWSSLLMGRSLQGYNWRGTSQN